MISEQVIHEFTQGLQQAFDTIYKAYAPGMYGVCLRYARCTDDAQDMLQESFIKIYTKRETYKHEHAIGAWIKTITINTALTYIRQQYKLQLFDDETQFDQSIQVEEPEATDFKSLQDRLLAILNQMPDGYRTVFNLFTLENLTHKEIAEHLQISESTSKSQLFKAKKMIQQIIELEKATYE